MERPLFSEKEVRGKAIMNKAKQKTEENTGENRQNFSKFEKENNYVKILLRTNEWQEIRQFRSAVWREAGQMSN